LQHIKPLIHRKRDLVDAVLDGRSPVDRGELANLFRKQDMDILAAYDRNRRYLSDKREFFNTMRNKMATGTLASSDINQMRKRFGETAAAKMTIVYNDRMAREGTSEMALPESPKIRDLRKRVLELRERRLQMKSIIQFLDGLNDRKFASSVAFLGAFRALGEVASAWIDGMDWRDRPCLVQYAIGQNERIENPVRRGEYLDEQLAGVSSWEQCRIGTSREELKHSITDILKQIKELSV
jgi:hypothetical protein